MRLTPVVVLTALLCLATIVASAGEKDSADNSSKTAAADQAALEKAFARQLSGSSLVGTFTIDGKENDAPKSESYHIESAKKVDGDDWIILARAKWGKNDVKVPFPVKVKWAGDTPMIQLTELEIPTMGTFSARVLFYEDRYAGTWQHGKVGGHMFGLINKDANGSGKEAPKRTGKDK